eukprot:scaffold19898_cov34-Tisochrysis_lutea.AAC.4
MIDDGDTKRSADPLGGGRVASGRSGEVVAWRLERKVRRAGWLWGDAAGASSPLSRDEECAE